MWHLKNPSEEQLEIYSAFFKADLEGDIDNSQTIKRAFLTHNNSLDKDLINEILIAKPGRLFEINQIIMTNLISTYSEVENDLYYEIKNKKTEKTPEELIIFDLYNPIYNNIQRIFNYDKKISGDKKKSYEIAEIKGRNTCTYCNRQYTLFVVRDGGTNKDNRIVRPEFDHWFSKQRYPLLALSFYNLISSCHICNSSVKGTEKFSFNTHVHPYLEEHNNLSFNFTRVPILNGNWSIAIEDKETLDQRVINTIGSFELEEIYEHHSSLELKDIMDFREGNNNTYLEVLLNNTLIHFPQKKPQDVYRMLFGVEFKSDLFLDRPFSKLKYDILKKEGMVDILLNYKQLY